MARVKRGVTTRAKHKNILEQAKGFYGRRKNTIRIARQAVEKAGQYAYRDRKVNKRNFRALWIQRINAAVRAEGMAYGVFMHGLKLAGDLGVKRQIVVVNKVEVDEDLLMAKRELDGNAQQIMSVSYDREVVEADKKGALLLDYAPHSSSLRDIVRVEQFMLSEA